MRDPQDYAQAYDFPEMEHAMPKRKQEMFPTWGWSIVATALTFGLLISVTLGGAP